MRFFKENPVTVLLIGIVVLVTIIGGVVVISHPETLTFEDYLDKLGAFVAALGLLAVARGAVSLGKSHVEAKQVEAVLNSDPADEEKDIHDVPGA